jgi:predicted nucleic-acid-binding Zn-ribbon protein
MSGKCPKCGSDHAEREAVDIGVGTQYGPLVCLDCGWSETDELADLMVGDAGNSGASHAD